MPLVVNDAQISLMSLAEKDQFVRLASRFAGLLEFGPAADLVEDLELRLTQIPQDWEVTRRYLQFLVRDLTIVSELQEFRSEIADDEDDDRDEEEASRRHSP
jgi:hypothetical protein